LREASLLIGPPINGRKYRPLPQSVAAFPLLYQWQFDGANINAATNSDLVFTAVAATNAGSYDVIITNAYGSVTSAPVTLSVLGVPVWFETKQGGILYSNGQLYLQFSGLTGQGSVLIQASQT
jgi:hypothetical protein